MGRRNQYRHEKKEDDGVREMEQLNTTADVENEEVTSIVENCYNIKTRQEKQVIRKIKGRKSTVKMTSPQEFKCSQIFLRKCEICRCV